MSAKADSSLKSGIAYIAGMCLRIVDTDFHVFLQCFWGDETLVTNGALVVHVVGIVPFYMGAVVSFIVEFFKAESALEWFFVGVDTSVSS